jgi:hypothetical protein
MGLRNREDEMGNKLTGIFFANGLEIFLRGFWLLSLLLP